MNYEQLETDIVTRLQPYMPAGVNVVPLPESDADMQGKPFINSRVTVMYTGSKYGDPGENRMRSTGQMVQNETVMFDVFIQSRYLRTGDDSLHKMIPLVKRKLIGFVPTDCDRCFMDDQKIDIDKQDQSDIFNCVLSFRTTTLAVEEYDDTTDNGAVITSIEHQNEVYGNIQVP